MKSFKKAVSLLLVVVMLIGFIPIMPVEVEAVGVQLYWPVPGHTTISVGFHDSRAIDIADPNISGATVIASIGGTIDRVYKCSETHYGNISCKNCYGYGTSVSIKGTDGRIYMYGHMQPGSIPSNIYAGGPVSACQTLGKVGNTGNSKGPHLHFAISINTIFDQSGNINPLNETYVYSSAPSSSIDTSYRTPFTATVNSDTDITAYDAVDGDEYGVLWGKEKCTILEVYTNGWCKLKDSVDNTKYVQLNVFYLNDIDYSFIAPFSTYVITDSNVQAYDAVNGSESGVIWPDENCTVLEVYTNGWCKIKDSLDLTKFVPLSVFDLYTIDYSYTTPFDTTVNSSVEVTAYDAVNGNTDGVMWANEKCTILEVYTNGWCKLRDSIDNIKYIPYKTVLGIADIGTGFTAPILNKDNWKIIENNNGVVQTADETGSANQLWYFERQSDGSYRIYSCQDKTCLDVYGAFSDSGTIVQTYPAHDSDAQKWYIYEQSGGYVLKAKCTDCVLDLPNNDPTNGTQLQIWTKNDTEAQIWAIYKGEECKLTSPTLSVSAGNSISTTTFTWSGVYGEKRYDVKIWKNKLYEGDAYHVEWGATSGYSIILPPGTYQAYVDATHEFDCKMSNVVEFTVKAPTTYTIEYDSNGGKGAPSNQTKTHDKVLVLSSETPTRTGYTFLGWSTDKNATVAEHLSGGEFTINADTTLYAVWEKGCPGEHNYEATVTAPTCTIDGFTTYTCADCGDTYTDDYTSALGHKTELVSYVAPTCTEIGYSGDTVCINCTEVIEKGHDLESSGHSYVEAVTAPTCIEDGYTMFTCENCNDSYTGDYTDALGHSYDDGVCTACGASAPSTDDSEYTLGDINADGSINGKDSNQLKQFISGSSMPTAAELLAADVNGDGAINGVDANIFAQFLSGAIGGF